MVINLFDKKNDKIYSKYSSKTCKGDSVSSNLLNTSLHADDTNSNDPKNCKTKKKINAKSPYLADHVRLFSRIMEKTVNKGAKEPSHHPDIDIYKANSDDLRGQKYGSKKMKKSVLTLPNVPSVMPQACTVSDINDSEYLNRDGNKLKVKKRFVAKNKGKILNKAHEFYDNDAQYCSPMDINLDCSSTDIVKQFPGDCKRKSSNFYPISKHRIEKEFSAHDMWTVLRNINRFQFRPSPPMSDDDSIKSPNVKKKKNKRRKLRKDTRVVETCRTEEYAYVSSFGINDRSHTNSHSSSSFDRITVIDKQDEFSEICKRFETNVTKTNNSKANNRRFSNNLRNSHKNMKMVDDKADTSRENKSLIGRRKNTFNNRKQDINKPSLENGVISTQNNSDVVRVPINQKNIKCFNERNQYQKTKIIPLHCLQSGSSKVCINNDRTGKNDESAPRTQGITKVILSKGDHHKDGISNEALLKRKPRLAMTIPSTVVTQKLTQTDIYRRLANIKYPIVVLGKDHLTSFEVSDYTPPQFEGLEKQIWPFMQDWYDQNIKNAHGKHKQTVVTTGNGIMLSSENKPKNIQDIGDRCDHLTSNKNEVKKRQIDPKELNFRTSQYLKVPKSNINMKDKMLKLLYKNKSVKKIVEQQINCEQEDFKEKDEDILFTQANNINKTDASTEITEKSNYNSQNNINKFKPDIKSLRGRNPRANGKWASDFVDNVIRKIDSGVYFNQEQEYISKATYKELKEASMQTTQTSQDIEEDNIYSGDEIGLDDVTNKCTDLMPLTPVDYKNSLPGFDEILPELEVKTLNRNEMSIKHCTTNIVVQFEIKIPPESQQNLNPLTKCSSLIPLAITKSYTKVFKCKTTILNAMLPAEICSIIPTILKTLVCASRSMPPANTAQVMPYQNDYNLYTISELTRSGSLDLFKYIKPPFIGFSSTLTKLMAGMYKNKSTQIINEENYTLSLGRNAVQGLLGPLATALKWVPYTINFLSINSTDSKGSLVPRLPSVGNFSEESPCTALEIYKKPLNSNNAVILNTMDNNSVTCSVTNLMVQMWNQNLRIRFKISPALDTFYVNNSVLVNLHVINIERKQPRAMIGFNSLKMDHIDPKCIIPYNVSANNKVIANSDYSRNGRNGLSIKEFSTKPDIHDFSTNSKARKKSFINLYKKYKSTSSISGERHSASLAKITNLDDFFQIIGSGKTMSSIFDGNVGKKILSAVSEMKNWITELSQRQAMLVLLLINKKDTANLTRFRPILLQGIAVNRITRASELDMEIEVIERENFNSLWHYDGVSYLPDAYENQDNLLEELYWIAKTTASDYQKPFNESSEKLLKSLLEKRKKLNPSYLRVMARYVGLGLLKQPGRK